jgi:GT2 family glycosyltransferase
MRFSVCVPVYKRHEEPNVSTLAESLPAAGGDLDGELIVALNGISAAEAGVPAGVRTVDLAVNRGVGPGWNAAARLSEADVLVFANDDASLGPRSLELLARALEEHEKAGVVGALGSRFDFRTGRHISWVDAAGKRPGELEPCDLVAGFLFALRRRDFQAVGGFDEAYAPATMEEVDLTVAVERRLGLRSFVVAGVAYEHDFGVSSAPVWRRIDHNGRREFLFAIHRRNRRHFYRKWSGQL